MNTIIFDLDGTLVDSSYAIAGAINYTRSKLGLKPMDEKILLENVNSTSINPSEFFYGSLEFKKEHGEFFNEYYSQNCLKHLRLYGGIKELLQALKPHYNLAVATNASSVFARQILKHTEILEFFSLVVAADDVGRSKPDPEMILRIKAHFKSPAYILFGDSQKDKQAAKNADILFGMVAWGFSEYENVINLPSEIEGFAKRAFGECV